MKQQQNKSALEFELAIFIQTSNREHDIKHDAIVINMCQSAPGIICTLA